MAESSSVQSLERAFDLLEKLCRSRNGMTIGTLSAETGLHKSTVHRLLATMCTRGYVQRDAETSVYRAGMRLCELSSYIVENMDVIERARAPLERLGHETGETVHLVLQEERDIVYIHKVESVSGAIRMFSRIGMRRPLYCTGVGKAILATWPDEERARSGAPAMSVRGHPIRSWMKPRFFRSWRRSGGWATRWITKKTSWACAASRRRFRIIGGAPRMRSRFPRR